MTILERVPDSAKVWTTLVTNTNYLDGVLALEYSLRRVNSKYPLLVLFTDGLSNEGHEVLDKHKIYKKQVSYLLPTAEKDYSNDPRFYDCWSKLQPFSLYQFKRVCQLDSDMIVVENMDELLEIPLDGVAFAASYACVCNPYKKEHYPKDWIAKNCMYTGYTPGPKPWMGPAPKENRIVMCNGGLQVVVPNKENFDRIMTTLENTSATSSYDFADQSLLSDIFKGKWLPLSYKYNALKTLRVIHSDIWSDSEVKNIHYILNPKPWETREDDTGTFAFWHRINDERLALKNGAV